MTFRFDPWWDHAWWEPKPPPVIPPTSDNSGLAREVAALKVQVTAMQAEITALRATIGDVSKLPPI